MTGVQTCALPIYGIKEGIFNGFLKDRKMGGLMITEPDFGSDALHMRTSYTEAEDSFHIKGTKHWAGLTGWADYWVLTARRDTGDGNLARDIDFFVCDVSAPDQNIVVEEYFENLGIYMLPYGRNRLDVKIPANQRLKPEGSGIRMMLDLLHRSRMQFPGMGTGFLQRMLDEAVSHCKDRQVGGRSLFGYDQVQQRLSRLQSAYTVCSAMCLNSAGKAGVEKDLSGIGLEANSVKTYVTDLMQASAQSLLQLVGAKGYRLDHIAGRAVVDSRPFQIFEGSNDILYIQIAEAVQKLMQQGKETNLLGFLAQHDLTALAVEEGRLRELLDFSLTMPLSQRRLTELGAIISRIVAVAMVMKLADTGYNKALIDNCILNVGQELAGLVGGYHSSVPSDYVDSYEDNSSWFALSTVNT